MKFSQVRYPSKFVFDDLGEDLQFKGFALGELLHEKLFHVFVFGQELEILVNFRS
jgi:hypothetical protein